MLSGCSTLLLVLVSLKNDDPVVLSTVVKGKGGLLDDGGVQDADVGVGTVEVVGG